MIEALGALGALGVIGVIGNLESLESLESLGVKNYSLLTTHYSLLTISCQKS